MAKEVGTRLGDGEVLLGCMSPKWRAQPVAEQRAHHRIDAWQAKIEYDARSIECLDERNNGSSRGDLSVTW
jgi:hypothetical protein